MASRWQHKRLAPAINEKYNNDTELIVNQYNAGLESIQQHIADQNHMIDTIASNTYKRTQINDMIDTVKSQFENTRDGLTGQISNLESDVQGRVHHTFADVTFAKKMDVSNTLKDYAKSSILDAKLYDINQHATDTYLSKSSAQAMYADRGKVFEMETQVGNIKSKQTHLEEDQQALFDHLSDYATKADLSGYARYTDYASLNTSLGQHVVNTNDRHTTVSKFMADQTQMNLDLVKKNLDLTGELMNLESAHEDLVDELGNYLTADAVHNLLQSSYAPLNSFNLLDQNVDTLEKDLMSLDGRTRIVENDLTLKKTQICLRDPNTKQDACMLGTDFALLRNIMNEYYADQAEDAVRLAQLEQQRQDADTYMRNIEGELFKSEQRRQLMAEQNAKDREKIKREAQESDIALQQQLTLAITQVRDDANDARLELQAKLVAEEQKLETERQNLLNLNTQLVGLQSNLFSVQEQDIEHNNEINLLNSMIPVLQEQKKNLEQTVFDKINIIQNLSTIITTQEHAIQTLETNIIVQEEQLESCGLVRDKCVITDLPVCRALNITRQMEIDGLVAQVHNLQSDLVESETNYSLLDHTYKNLQAECAPKITQDFCDSQTRTPSRQTLFRGDEYLFNTDIITRNILDWSERNRVDTLLKQKAVNDKRALWQIQNPEKVNKLDGYPNSLFRWETTVPECPDFTEERHVLQSAIITHEKNHNVCQAKLQSCETNFGLEQANHQTCITNHGDCIVSKQTCETDLANANLNKCNDCNYMSNAYGKVKPNGGIDDSTIHLFSYKDTDHLDRLQQKAGNGSWALVNVMHKPNCDAQINSLKSVSNAPKWVKYHGYPNGMVSLSTLTKASQNECKDACEQNSACSLYTYNKSNPTNNCELKSSIPIFET